MFNLFNLIKFVDRDADGCGTEVSCFVKVDAEMTNGDKERLQNLVDEIKSETEDWDFDLVVEEACERYFKPRKIEYRFVGIDMVIDL